MRFHPGPGPGPGPVLVLHRFLLSLRCSAYSQVSSLHFSHALLKREERTLDRSARNRFRGSETSDQSNRFKDEPVLVQGRNQWRNKGRVSSELRRLIVDDFPEERQKVLSPKQAQDLKAENLEVVYGVAPCLLALTQGRRKVDRLLVKEGVASHRASVVRVCEEAFRRHVPVRHVGKKDLDVVSCGGVHQGVCLRASPLSYATEEPKTGRNHGTNSLWLVLEKIQDPMNLGAILRSAYFLGVDRVVSSLQHSCPLSPVVSKASSGAMEVMEVFGYQDLAHMLRTKASLGWDVVGTVGADAEHGVPVAPCSRFTLSKPTLLLIGGEGPGLSPELLSMCRTLLTIPAGGPLVPGIESLNVSVAVGILLHALLSSRVSDQCM
ncbi:rRNA methyltransferase 1, mitochondrial [Gouania willdenowi]|uniref:rRNA methyltransferase 1, mitochondrial n=1 Tax=Gouania willdenowi TaxID=441366 RepID=A0A8C5HQ02_GOUWI|nr:rRNA methyltransferase 1, mitochondrial [Gouania willdenowi]